MDMLKLEYSQKLWNVNCHPLLVLPILQPITQCCSVDPETGKKIRGQKCEVRDYDQFVFDIYAKYIPQPVEIKTQDSVYDHYDILEEIGTGAFGVVSFIQVC